jgi:hypothetical protein
LRLAGTEGITMRVKSEGHTYACVLRTGRVRVWCVGGTGAKAGEACRNGVHGRWQSLQGRRLVTVLRAAVARACLPCC